ncbi:MAG: hypothetical protein SOV26_03825 [Candidatus Onthovivens sp.]|nr:hypothetical protein [Candidatus Onthovivens sp.]
MNIVLLERNYLPIDVETRLHACLHRTASNLPIRKILSFYHIKKYILSMAKNI